jgi:NADPH:quinone reductase-like Zn-dependent oxidoreductase
VLRAIVNTPGQLDPTAIHDIPEPAPKAHEALVVVRAFSVNPGELGLLAARPEGWHPGQDVSGVVLEAAPVICPVRRGMPPARAPPTAERPAPRSPGSSPSPAG